MKKALSFILASAMVMSMTACGSSSNSSSTSTEQSSAAVTIGAVSNQGGTGTSSSTEGGATTAEEKVIDENKKKEIVVSAPTEPKCMVAWDPNFTMSVAHGPYALQVYEAPFKLMTDGSIENVLATGYEWTDDFKHLTLHFRDDVHFSNGDPMTAEDVAFSFNMTAPSKSGKTIWTNFESCDVVGDYDVTINLTNPNAGLMNVLSGRLASIYDKKYYDEVGLEGYIEKPIGTGPYILTERELADHQTYEINENYWNKEDMPFYEKVTLKFLGDSNTQMLALENGEIDVLLSASIGPFLKLGEDSNIGYVATQATTVLAMLFNQNWGLTKDERFRQMLQYAINRDDINLGVYEGLAEVTDTYGPSLLTAYPDPGTYTPVPSYDPEKAKEILQEIGYNGEEFIISVQQGTKAEQAAVIIQGQLLNINVNCTVKALDQASTSALQKLPEGWNASMRSAVIPAMDMDTMRTHLSYDHTEIQGQYQRWQRVDELEDLFAQTTQTADNEVRKQLYAQITSYCNEHAYYIPLINEFSVIGYNKNVKGVKAYPADGIVYYKEWY